MNPTTRLLFLAVAVLSCGRSVPIEVLSVEVEPPSETMLEDSLVEVRVGAIGHCTRSRVGRVECEATFSDEGLRSFTVVERGARALSVSGGFGYCGNWLTACALLEDGKVTCARGGTHVCVERRSEVHAERAQSISIGSYRGCVLEAGGDVMCGGDMLDDLLPIPGMENSVALSCGYTACCAVNASGRVTCLSEGTLHADPHPLPSSAVAVTVGGNHACALDGEGIAHCWTLRNEDELPPTPLTAGVAVSAGGQNSCVLDARGVVTCGATQPFDVPLVQMEAGVLEVCGIDAEAQLHCAPLPHFYW